MRPAIALWIGLSGWLCAQNPMLLETVGVPTEYLSSDGTKHLVRIERRIPKECLDVGIELKTVFGGDYAGKEVPLICQKSVVTVLGKAQPMQLDPAIATLGEVEVLSFIHDKRNRFPEHYVLIDARKRDWFEQMTIPGAINVPYDEIDNDPDFPEDFQRMMRVFGFSYSSNGFDFSHAKTAVIFCNASWCAQSRYAIEKLVKMGYPKEKLLWYRGGMQDWVLFGFSVVKP